MSKSKSKTKAKSPADDGRRIIAENRKARHKYEVIDMLECGIMLVGSEVKSLREGKLSLDESYGRVRDGEVWLVGADIAEYKQASIFNHDPKRPRKLLVHRSEIKKFAGQAHEKGLTLVPLKMYFNERGKVKLLLGLCRGRKLHDKRDVMKKAEVKRDLDRAVKARNRS